MAICFLSGLVSHEVRRMWVVYLLDDQLRNAVSNLDLEVVVGEVGKNDTHRPSVVCVNHTSHCVNAVLGRKTGARRYTAVYGR